MRLDNALTVLQRALWIAEWAETESALPYICAVSVDAVETYGQLRENPLKLLFVYDCYYNIGEYQQKAKHPFLSLIHISEPTRPY